MSMQLYCAGMRAGEGARLVLPPGGCGAKLCCEAPDNGEGDGAINHVLKYERIAEGHNITRVAQCKT